MDERRSAVWPKDVVWAAPNLLQARLQGLSGVTLTAREVDVVSGVIAGRTSKKMAQLLRLSPRTVDNYLRQAMSKYQVHSKDGLIDAVERSGTQGGFKQHYGHIQLQPVLAQWLQGLAASQSGVSSVWSVTQSVNGWWQALVRATEANLRLAGFEVVSVEASKPWAGRSGGHGIRWLADGDAEVMASLSEVPEGVSCLDVGMVSPDTTVPALGVSTCGDFYEFMRMLLVQLMPGCDDAAFRLAHARMLGHPTIQPMSMAPEPMVESATITWNLPAMMAHYTERSEITRLIWERLQHRSKATVVLAGLRGMGGVGKTTLALEAIHYPSQPYALRAWFRAESEALLKADYVALGLCYHVITTSMSEVVQLNRVTQWLAEQSSSLLVYDNAPDMATIQAWLPHRGHVLITSRNQAMPQPVDVDGMTWAQARRLLAQLHPMGGSESMDVLIETLGALPLALAQAGAYMAQNGLSVTGYLQRYQRVQGQLLAQRVLPPGDHHEPVYVTWDLNLEALASHPRGAQALALLDAMAYVYPEHIPKVWLAQWMTGAMDVAALTELDEVLGLLRRYSLVKTTERDISIHRLVQAYLRHRHEAASTQEMLRRSLHQIILLRQDHRWDYDLMKSLLPHTECVIEHGVGHLTDIQQAELNVELAWMCFAAGRYKRARKLMERILTKLLCYSDKHSLKISDVYYDLGCVYQTFGALNEAEKHLKKALHIKLSFHAQSILSISSIYRSLGWLYRGLGKWEEAQNFYRKSLSLQKNYPMDGTIPLPTAHAYRGLGWTYLYLGRLNKAKNFLEKSLRALNFEQQGHHIWIANIYHGLSMVYLDLNQFVKAKRYCEQSLLYYQHHYKESPAWTIYVYQSMGDVCRGLAHLNEALSWYDKALPFYEDQYGQNHIWTGYVYRGLAWCYQGLGDLMKSEIYFKQAFSIYNNSHHIWLGDVLHGLGAVYLDLGQYNQSKMLLERALPIYEAHYGPHHRLNQPLLYRLSQLYEQLGFDEEKQYFIKQAKLAVKIDKY